MNTRTLRHLALWGMLLTAVLVLSGGSSEAGDPVTGDIYVVSSTGGARRALTGGGYEIQPSLSPDGRLIAYLSNQGIRLMNTDGSEQRPLGTAGGERPQWSPDGSSLVYTGENGDLCNPPPAQRCVVAEVWRVNADGTEERKLFYAAQDPVWSPGGRRLLFRDFVVGEPGEVHSLKVAWPDGSHVRTLFSRRNDRTEWLSSVPAWSPNGKWIAFTYSTVRAGGLFLIRADGSHLRRLTSGGYPAWSPDGKLIAFERNRGIWVISPTGKHPRRITTDGRCPTWSPRGKRIAFLTNSWPGPSRLVVVRRDGHGRKVLAVAADCYAYGWAESSPPVWSPDGRRIYFVG